MAYIAKLARRLAQNGPAYLSGMVSALLLAACAAGEPVSGVPSDNDLQTTETIVVAPRTVLLEPSQQVRFFAYESLLPGSDEVTAIEWTATGGAIGTDGGYLAGNTGDFRVVGKRKGWNRLNPPADTATVIVTAPQPTVVALEVSPTTAKVAAGGRLQYSAMGFLSDSTEVPVGVTWSATGGSIDAGGMFTGLASGTFTVTATHTATGVSARATVTVVGVTGISLSPSSVSLAAGQSKQYTVTGTMSDGTTGTVQGVTFSATGGTISSSGLYTAPLTAGSFTVNARMYTPTGATLAASAAVTVASLTAIAPAPSAGCNNKPSGYRGVNSKAWTAIPPLSPDRDEDGWTLYYSTSNLSIQSESSTSATSSGKILRVRYPAGQPQGTAPARYGSGPFGSNGGNVYMCVWVRISSNWTNADNPGTKFTFLKTGAYDSGNTANWLNHYWGFDAGGSPTNMALMAGLQYGDASMNRTLRSGANLSLGSWHKVEMLWQANTPGTANGKLKAWLDDRQVMDRSDVLWFLSGQTPQWNRYYPLATYGGNVSPVPYDMYMDVGNTYIAVY
jgi:hypothetical protein